MLLRRLWFSILTGVVLVAIACGPAATPTPTPTPTPSPTPSPTPNPSPTTPAGATGPATVKVTQHPQLGSILTDGSGKVLYLFTRDERNKSNCSGGCLRAWPPLLTQGNPTAGEGVTANILGTITRDDGSVQVTYNGWPLYYYAQDQQAGDAKGQNVNNVWFVLGPDGGPIQNNATVKVAQHPTLGNILVDLSGRVLYLFTNDQPNTSNCAGGCARAWPPLLTVGNPTAGEGANASLLGTTTRQDGSTQVTYNGWPLYYYARDEKPGDATGQNVNSVWFVVSPAGEALR